MWVWTLFALSALPVVKEADLSGFRKVRVEASLIAAEVKTVPVEGTILRVEAAYPEGELEELVFNLQEKNGEAILEIQTDLREWGGWRGEMREGGEVRIELPEGVELDLRVSVAATEAEFDLSGLPLTEIRLKGAASELEFHFDRPNPKRGGDFRIKVAAAEIRIKKLGNAGFRKVELRSAVSDLSLDLRGSWRENAEVEIKSALANVEVTAPTGLPLRVKAKGFLTGQSIRGLIRTDEGWETPDFWERSPRVTLRFSGALSAFDLDFE